MSAPYPETASERDEWIRSRRGPRAALDPRRPHAFLLEEERTASGAIATGPVVFLTNRECPWRCVMCDLWKNTLPARVPPGAIPAQIDFALDQLRGRWPDGSWPFGGQIKLYNSGSFFDPGAIPPSDHPAIAERVAGFDRLIVECHPAFVLGNRALRGFKLQMDQARERLGLPPAVLEIAMGLETAHPEALSRLNKRMTLTQFRQAAECLREQQFALRAFVLVQPPFIDASAGREWTRRSLQFAFECGATAVSAIPTRFGNGALETLAGQGQFAPPELQTLEDAAEFGVRLGRGRVFADLWDLEAFSNCPACFAQRRERLRAMNLTQTVPPPVDCKRCSRFGVLEPENPL